MAVTMGQWAVPGNATVPVFTIPPGPVAVTFWNPGTQAVYVGSSTLVSAVNGAQCPSSPAGFTGWPGSRGQQVYATTGNATAGTIHCIISTGG